MSLSDLASLGSFVSGVAVLASLVFLYFQLGQVRLQITQAEKNQQASIRQARVTRAVDIALTRENNPALTAVLNVIRTEGQLDPEQFRAFANYAACMFLHAEDSFYQHRNGLLDESAFNTFVFQMQAILRSPAWRATWKHVSRGNYDGDFASFIDGLIRETPAIRPGTAVYEAWKKDVATAIANAEA